MDGCAGDARLYDWAPKGYGTVDKVLWTALPGESADGVSVTFSRTSPDGEEG